MSLTTSTGSITSRLPFRDAHSIPEGVAGDANWLIAWSPSVVDVRVGWPEGELHVGFDLVAHGGDLVDVFFRSGSTLFEGRHVLVCRPDSGELVAVPVVDDAFDPGADPFDPCGRHLTGCHGAGVGHIGLLPRPYSRRWGGVDLLCEVPAFPPTSHFDRQFHGVPAGLDIDLVEDTPALADGEVYDHRPVLVDGGHWLPGVAGPVVGGVGV